MHDVFALERSDLLATVARGTSELARAPHPTGQFVERWREDRAGACWSGRLAFASGGVALVVVATLLGFAAGALAIAGVLDAAVSLWASPALVLLLGSLTALYRRERQQRYFADETSFVFGGAPILLAGSVAIARPTAVPRVTIERFVAAPAAVDPERFEVHIVLRGGGIVRIPSPGVARTDAEWLATRFDAALAAGGPAPLYRD